MNENVTQSLILDRVEGSLAILEAESGELIELDAGLLPSGAREGDVFLYDGFSLAPDEDATAARRERIRNKLDQLFGRNE